MMALSLLPTAKAGARAAAVARTMAGSPPQLSFAASTAPAPVDSLSVGSAWPLAPKLAPSARTKTSPLSLPAATNPSTLLWPADTACSSARYVSVETRVTSASYTSTSAVPVPPAAPATCTVYVPGLSVATTAASFAPAVSPNAPTPAKTPASALSQLSLLATTAPLASLIVSTGSLNPPATPYAASDGPTARTATRLAASLLIVNAAVTPPAGTGTIADRFTSARRLPVPTVNTAAFEVTLPAGLLTTTS